MTPSSPRKALTLSRLFADLDDSSVRWALLRGQATLGDQGRDVDLLVSREDLIGAELTFLRWGGVALPLWLHPWHRFYVVPDGGGSTITLDVVTQLIYHRRLRLRSDLESGCLARRRASGQVQQLSPTDAFWTTLLHCLLDKHQIRERRRTELLEHLSQLTRPSPGEAYFTTLCPEGWTPDRVLVLVRAGQWEQLSALGRSILARSQGWATAQGVPSAPALRGRARTRLTAAVRAAYPTLSRAMALSDRMRVFDLLEEHDLPAVAVHLRRAPRLRSCVLMVSGDLLDRVEEVVGADGYERNSGSWRKRTLRGSESVRLVSPASRGVAEPAARHFDDAAPLAGCARLRWLPRTEGERILSSIPGDSSRRRSRFPRRASTELVR
jgi:hypothetical protein